MVEGRTLERRFVIEKGQCPSPKHDREEIERIHSYTYE